MRGDKASVRDTGRVKAGQVVVAQRALAHHRAQAQASGKQQG